jgi:hypothetical protein
VTVPNRRDNSVNGAWVDNFQNAAGPSGPIFRSQTNLNPVGGFFSASATSVGNKALLGKSAGAGILLSSLVSMQWTVTNLQPEGFPAPPVNGYPGIPLPYCNLIVDLGMRVGPPAVPAPVPGGIVILVFGDQLNALNLGVYSSPGPNQYRCVWTRSLNGVLTVNGKGMSDFIGPPPPPTVFVPAFAGGVQLTPLTWGSFSRWVGQPHSAPALSSILDSYPLATIVDANPLDGGMPGPTGVGTVIAGHQLVLGDSANRKQASVRLDEWKINGIDV